MTKRRKGSRRTGRSRAGRPAVRRLRWRRRVLLALVAAGAAAYLVHRPTLRRLQARHAELRDRLAALEARDPLLGHVPDTDLALAVPAGYTQRLAEGAAGHLLESAPLSLTGIRFRKEGAVDKRLLFAPVQLGRWSLDVRLRSLTGTVRGGRPRLTHQDSGPIGVTVPVTLSEGRATGSVRFAWDSSGVANVVCRDFSLSLPVEAAVVSEPHAFEGRVRVEVDRPGGALVAAAGFGEQSLRARVDPSPDTWSRLRRRLEAEDTFWRCGVGLDPDDVIARLRELAADGFPIKLPPRHLRPLRVPASFRVSLGAVAPVELQVSPAAVVATRGVVWLGAQVEARALRPAP